MTNIDQTEVAKFDALAHKWWDLEGEFKPLHQINPLRLNFICSHIDLSGKKILDVGCGGGILAESLIAQNNQVTGIDLSSAALKAAEIHQHDKPNKVTYRNIAVEALAKAIPASFDVITCMELLEHVPQPQSIVAACAKLIKPDGHIVFSTLNRNLKAYLLAVIGAEYILGLIPKGTHDYSKFIRPSELLHWARQQQLTPIKMQGISYNPLTKVYKLTDDVSVNYVLSLKAQ